MLGVGVGVGAGEGVGVGVGCVVGEGVCVRMCASGTSVFPFVSASTIPLACMFSTLSVTQTTAGLGGVSSRHG